MDIELKTKARREILPEPPQKPPQNVKITPPNFKTAAIKIKGTAPFVSNKFSARAQEAMRLKQEEGSTAKNRKNRQPKDFDTLWRETLHTSKNGWYGIPASAFRAALVSACRVAGLPMTVAKLTVFVEADGYDRDTGEGLIEIRGKPRRSDMPVRLAGMTTDICTRAMFDEWSAVVKVRWDADQFGASDIVNLMARVGGQVGVGAGRPDSKSSTGMGWGTFEIVD